MRIEHTAPTCAAVLIGRNEGARLVACLASLQGQFEQIVYVDSGSTDGSQDQALAYGAHVIDLDTELPFTAARARNAGLEYLLAMEASVTFIQFLDGDCALQPGWIAPALAFLQEHTDVAVVCGRRRERFPEASVYNKMIDAEWDTPIGQTKACGGDALMRTAALRAVGGYNPNLIAGEEPELCVRLRAKGWGIWRLDHEMTLHDADLTRFGQWWQRAKRAGFAYAQGVVMHGAAPERHNLRQLQRAVGWGVLLPAFLVLTALFLTPWAILGALIWPAQVLRQYLKGTDVTRAFFLTLGKFPEAQGALTYVLRRIRGQQARLIEYK